jgi:hypothetical protein
MREDGKARGGGASMVRVSASAGILHNSGIMYALDLR